MAESHGISSQAQAVACHPLKQPAVWRAGCLSQACFVSEPCRDAFSRKHLSCMLSKTGADVLNTLIDEYGTHGASTTAATFTTVVTAIASATLAVTVSDCCLVCGLNQQVVHSNMDKGMSK